MANVTQFGKRSLDYLWSYLCSCTEQGFGVLSIYFNALKETDAKPTSEMCPEAASVNNSPNTSVGLR